MAFTLGDALIYLKADLDRLNQDLDKGEQQTKSWTSRVADGIGIALGDAIVGAVGKGIQAVGQLGQNVFQFSLDSQRAVGNLKSELGATADEARLLGDIAKQVWANNFGGDLIEAANVVGQVRQQIRSLNEEGIQGTAEFALAIRDTYGGDVPQTISATRTLVEDFNLTWQQASDFIAAGFQRGLNRSGDFLESITEYSPQFAAAQATAGQFFSAMDGGLQGGVLGTDKFLDMFKEFRVRILDGSETTAQGFQQIGLNIDEVTTRLQDGSSTITDVFQEVTGRLRQTDDQAVQMQAGVALLGTQFEDLGTQAATAVDLAATSMDDLEGAADALGARYTNLSDIFTGFGRKLTLALSPASDALLDLVNDAMPDVEAGFNRFLANVQAFAVGFVGILRGAMTLGRAFFRGFRGDADTELGGAAENAGGWGRNIVLQLARGMAAAATAVVSVLNQIGQIITGWLKPGSPPRLLPDIDDWGKGLIDAYLSKADQADMSALHRVGDTIMGILGGFGSGESFSLFDSLSGTIQQMFQNLPDAAEDETIIGRIMGSRALLASLVGELEDTGQVSQATFEALAKSLKGLPGMAMDYVQAMVQAASATKEVEAAEEKLKQVMQEYEDRLKPLNDELQGIRDKRQDMADEKRLAQLRQAIARGALSEQDKELALMEIREIELQKAIDATEKEKETAVDAAQATLDAAEAKQKAAEEQLAIQQALIAAQQQGNEMIEQQANLLEQLAQTMEDVASDIGSGVAAAVGEGLGEALAGAGLGEDFDPLAGLDGAGLADGLADSLGEGLGDDLFDGLFDGLDVDGLVDEILGEFAPLEGELEGLGETFGTLGDKIGEYVGYLDPANEDGETFRQVILGIGIALATAAIAPTLAGIAAGLISLVSGLGSVGGIVALLGGPITIVIGLITALGLAWATNFLGIRDKAQEVIDYLQPLFEEFGNFFSGIWDSAGLVWDGFKALFSGDFETFGETIQEAWENAWQTVIDFLSNLWGMAEPKLTEWKDAAVDWFNNVDWKALGLTVITAVIVGLATFWATAETTINGWFDSFATWFNSVDWYGLGFSVVTFLLDALATFWATVSTTIDGWFESFATWFAEMDWYGLGFSVVTFLLDALTTFWATVSTTIDGWYESFLDWFKETDWQYLALWVIEQLEMKLKTFWLETKNTIDDWWRDMKSWFEEQDWGALATNIIDGIVQGVSSGASAVVGALTNLAQGMWDAWTQYWEQQSPSKVMIRSGENIAESGAIGVRNKMQSATAAMRDLADEFFKPVANLQAGVGGPTAVAAAPITPAAPAQTTIHNEFHEGAITLASGEAVRVFFEEYLRGLIDDRQLARVLG
ncbi:MAG: phage tail tape measure protein [Ardenticatenaceae bacterium]|nr:phage tail tape measure protein [Ardenticatenaceae bacterium]